jgi:hypothetical protein
MEDCYEITVSGEWTSALAAVKADELVPNERLSDVVSPMINNLRVREPWEVVGVVRTDKVGHGRKTTYKYTQESQVDEPVLRVAIEFQLAVQIVEGEKRKLVTLGAISVINLGGEN